MAKRGRRPNAPKMAANQGDVKREDYDTFMASVDNTKGTLDAARMANANEWKRADNINVHPAVAKQMLKLRKMDDIKRNAWLRAFDIYRGWEEFDETDMVDAAEEAAAAEAQAAENEEIRQEEIAERQEAVAAKDEAKAAAAEIEDSFTIEEEESGLAESTAAEPVDEEKAMQMGREACLRGVKKQTCPFAEDEGDIRDAWGLGWDEEFKAGRFGDQKAA